jgi:hypothetical protein
MAGTSHLIAAMQLLEAVFAGGGASALAKVNPIGAGQAG